MKTLLFLLLAICLYSSTTPVQAAVIPARPASQTATLSFTPQTLKLITRMEPREYEKLSGRKMKLKEKIAYKILQWKLRKNLRDGEPTAKQRKLGNLSLIFGILAVGFLFIPAVGILSLAFAATGLVLGLKSLRGNSNTTGLIGLILSGLVLFLFLLAVIIISGWDWY